MKLILTAAISAVLVTIAWNQYDAIAKRQQLIEEEALKAAEPATTWFVVRNLAVADSFAYNSEVPVVYDREIKRDFNGQWWAEVRNAEDKSITDCRGHGSSRYTTDDALPPAGVDLKWIIGISCHLPAGQYYLEISYSIAPANYPVKEYRAVSNVFTLKNLSQSKLEGMPYVPESYILKESVQ